MSEAANPMTSTVPMEELEAMLPCPFCGSAPSEYPQNTSIPAKAGGYTQIIWCENCGCEGPERQTDAEAIAAWNKRSNPELIASRERIAELEVALTEIALHDLTGLRDPYRVIMQEIVNSACIGLRTTRAELLKEARP